MDLVVYFREIAVKLDSLIFAEIEINLDLVRFN